MSEEQAKPDRLLVEHRLDLSLAADRAALVADNASHPKAALLAELDSYLRYLPVPELRTIYGGGMVTFGGHGYQLLGLLEVATQLDAMAHCPGFAELIAGFRNPTQFRSTVYEVRIASWCLARNPTRNIQFAPVVQTNRGLKKPDFLWETTLGSPYVECKQASNSENGMIKRLNRLFGIATKEYGLRPIDDDSVRLDLAIGQISNGAEERVRRVVRQ